MDKKVFYTGKVKTFPTRVVLRMQPPLQVLYVSRNN
jgi:hypothetical protein